MRHYLIIDFRSKNDFLESSIRKSINLDMKSESLDLGYFLLKLYHQNIFTNNGQI